MPFVRLTDHYIIGAPTLNAEAETGKTGTDWDPFLQGTFKQMGSLKGKTFAVFGLGDQSKYPWHFCDAMDEMVRHCNACRNLVAARP